MPANSKQKLYGHLSRVTRIQLNMLIEQWNFTNKYYIHTKHNLNDFSINSVFTGCINLPVAMYELYVLKLDQCCPFLWQSRREVKVNWIDECWYVPGQVGRNPLETFLKKLCEEASLEHKIYTNHSIRSTCISKLDDSGFKACHITALTSRKSEATIKQYSVKWPDKKKQEMFNALATPKNQLQQL